MREEREHPQDLLEHVDALVDAWFDSLPANPLMWENTKNGLIHGIMELFEQAEKAMHGG